VDGLWATKSEGLRLIIRAITFQYFPTYVILHDPPTLQTDRQSDRRTCNLNTALCTSASRGKN